MFRVASAVRSIKLQIASGSDVAVHTERVFVRCFTIVLVLFFQCKHALDVCVDGLTLTLGSF